MYMKTENSNQTVHNGFGQFPEIVQLRTRHSRHYLQFHILSLSLANDCPNISLSLLKDNARLQSSPSIWSETMQRLAIQPCQWFLFQFLVSTLLFRTKINLFFYVLAHTQITATHNITAHSKTYISKPMQHMQPSFPVQVISEPMQHMQPSPVRDVHSY